MTKFHKCHLGGGGGRGMLECVCVCKISCKILIFGMGELQSSVEKI